MSTQNGVLMLLFALSLWLCAPSVSASHAGTSGGQRTKPAEFVRQEEVVSFPRAGRVRVRAVEAPRTRPRLEFLSEETGRRLLSVRVGASDARAYRIESYATPMNPLVRFKVLETAGVPGPLVFAVAVKPGGTDHGFETNIIAEAGGRLKALNPAPLTNNIQGGVFVGDLGAGRGPGVAVWNFLWGDEAHYGAHRYEVRLLPFDARTASFGRGRQLRTKGKHANGRDALAELGLPRYANLLDEMSSIHEYRSN